RAQSSGIIRALDPKTGVTLWTREIDKPLQGGMAIDSGNIYGGSADGKVYSIDKINGTIVWTAKLFPSFASYATISDQKIFIGSDDGTLFAVNKVNGQVIWSYKAKASISSNITVTESKKVIAASTDGTVFAISQDSGKLKWHKRTGAAIHSIAVWSENVIVASLDNFVYFLSDKDGELVWKHRLPGRVYAPPLTKMSYALFSPVAGDSCIVLDLSTGKQVNTLPVGEDNNTMAAPVEANDVLLITTRQGLVAFASVPRGGSDSTHSPVYYRQRELKIALKAHKEGSQTCNVW
ncbi:MAG: PQQ-binding-like beta-propeller repeat protein, partial [Pyrinomonadaceae bacterium]